MPTQRDPPLETERRRRAFWDQASHDLRQPVQSLQLLAQVFSRQAETEPVRQAADHMRRVVDGLGQMHEALGQLLRLECGRSSPESRAVAFAPLARDVAQELYPVAHERRINLRVADTDASPETDAAWLALILRNLVALALRQCEGDDVSISGRKRKSGFSLVIEFLGPDIPPGQKASVFIEAAGPEDRRAILGPGYLHHLCALLGYLLDLEAGEAGRQRFTLTVPAAPPRA